MFSKGTGWLIDVAASEIRFPQPCFAPQQWSLQRHGVMEGLFPPFSFLGRYWGGSWRRKASIPGYAAISFLNSCYQRSHAGPHHLYTFCSCTRGEWVFFTHLLLCPDSLHASVVIQYYEETLALHSVAARWESGCNFVIDFCSVVKVRGPLWGLEWRDRFSFAMHGQILPSEGKGVSSSRPNRSVKLMGFYFYSNYRFSLD